MRRTFIFLMVLAAPAYTGAGDPGFSLSVNNMVLGSKGDLRTEARLAQWNSPMGRLIAAFQQQQAWIIRGTQPGLERVSGAVVGVRLRPGLPLEVLAASMDAGVRTSEESLAVVRWPWDDSREKPALPLEEQLSVLLGQRLEARVFGDP
ncbi:MAG: hypothetical protein ACC742_15075 [Thermoanaerobaculales bacterium]